VSTRLPSLVLLAHVALAAGCGETLISISSDGRIEVSVSTSGTDPDSDGFSVTVDGGAEHVVGPAGDVVLDGLSAGSHSVLLGGLAQNCAVVGSNPRPVIVGSDGRAEVSFEVRCERATTGGFTVEVVTTGGKIDPDGYWLAVAGSAIRPIGYGAIEVFSGLAPGPHLITLKDVDSRCTVANGNPRPFTVVAGETVLVSLTVACGAGAPPQAASRTTASAS